MEHLPKSELEPCRTQLPSASYFSERKTLRTWASSLILKVPLAREWHAFLIPPVKNLCVCSQNGANWLHGKSRWIWKTKRYLDNTIPIFSLPRRHTNWQSSSHSPLRQRGRVAMLMLVSSKMPRQVKTLYWWSSERRLKLSGSSMRLLLQPLSSPKGTSKLQVQTTNRCKARWVRQNSKSKKVRSKPTYKWAPPLRPSLKKHGLPSLLNRGLWSLNSWS